MVVYCLKGKNTKFCQCNLTVTRRGFVVRVKSRQEDRHLIPNKQLKQYLLGFMAFRLLLTSPKSIQLYFKKTLSGPHQLCYQVKKLRRNRTTQCANTMSESQNGIALPYYLPSQGICLCANMCCFEICVGRYRVTPALHLNMMDINLKVDQMNIVYVN